MNRAPKLNQKKQLKTALKKQPKRAITTTTTKRVTLASTTSSPVTKLTQRKSPLTAAKRTIVTALEAPDAARTFIEENSQGGKLVAVDFYADWCGPCQVLLPEFKKMSDKYPKTTFAKINADEFISSDIDPKFPPVNALPTVLFFIDNKVVESVIGMNAPKITAIIERYGV